MITVKDLLEYWHERYKRAYRTNMAFATDNEAAFHTKRDSIAKVMNHLENTGYLDKDKSADIYRLLHSKDEENFTLVELILEQIDISDISEKDLHNIKYSYL